MEAATVLAISELLKLTIVGYVAYMQQNGATDAQIETMFQEARKGMLARDPGNIPD